MLASNNFFQLIDQPTRGGNLLDLIISDSPVHFSDVGVLPALPGCDHDIIYGKYIYSYATSPSYTRTMWKYDSGDYNSINNELSANAIYDSTLTVEANVQVLTQKLHTLMDEFIPHTTVKIRSNDKPWYNSSVRKAYKECEKYFKLKNKTNDEVHIEMYKHKRSLAKNAFRQARKQYYDDLADKIIDPETTPKNYWKLVKSLFNNSKQSTIPTLFDNNSSYTNDKDKADLLNDYFIAQSTLPASNIPLPPFTYLTDARLGRIVILPQDVKKVLLNLNTSKAIGADKISNKLLKECAESLCIPLAEIFQQSLDEGIYPDTWKEAIIAPIFKKLDRQIKSNYRPISLLSCLSKVFEKLVFNNFYNYLVANGLLSDDNSGFRKNDSAINRILTILESVYKGYDDSLDSMFVSLDISKEAKRY